MRAVDQLERSAADLRAVSHGRLPAGRFHRADFAALERARLWPNVWTVAGPAARWDTVGAVDRVWLGHRDALVVRGQDSNLRAFANTCRHRGAQLCSERSSVRQITCPVHGWSWQLTGARLGESTPLAPPATTVRDTDLLPLPCAERFGLVWVAGSAAVAPLDAYLGEVVGALAALEDLERTSNWRAISDTTIQIAADWKTSADMHNEAYHLPHLHPELSGRVDLNAVRQTPLGAHHQLDFGVRATDETVQNVTQIHIFPNVQITLHPTRAMVLCHRAGREVGRCEFDEMTLKLGDAGAAQCRPERVVVDSAQARIGAMAAADLRATEQLAHGLLGADHDLALHALEAGIWHNHVQLDRLLFGPLKQAGGGCSGD